MTDTKERETRRKELLFQLRSSIEDDRDDEEDDNDIIQVLEHNDLNI